MDARVQITDNGKTDESDDFTVTGSIALVTPTAAQVWKVETPDDISDNPIEVSWTFTGQIGTFDLLLDDEGLFSGNERTVRSSIANAGDNGDGCTVPSGGGCVILSGGQVPQFDETTGFAQTAKFRLQTDGGTPNPQVITDLPSTAAFEIRPWYEITTPINSTEFLVDSTTDNIVWNTHGDGLGNYDIHYKNDTGSWQSIVTNRSTDINDGDAYTFPWNPIPDETCAGPPSGLR